MKLSDYIPDWIMLILAMLILLAAFDAFGMICGCVKIEDGAFKDAIRLDVNVTSNRVAVSVAD